MRIRAFGLGIVIFAFAAFFYFKHDKNPQSSSIKENDLELTRVKRSDPIPRQPASISAATINNQITKPIKPQPVLIAKNSTLKQILKNRDLCALLALNNTKYRYTIADREAIAEHIFGPKNPDTGSEEKNWTLEDYLTLGHGSIADSLGAQKYQILQFYNALYLSDLINDASPDEFNFKRSYEILSELKNQDPNNGAFPFFMAAVKEKMKAPQSEIDEQLRLTLQASSFDTFDAQTSQVIFEKGLKDYIESFAVNYIIGFKLTANLGPSHTLLKAYVLANPLMQDAALAFGKKLILNQQDAGPEFLDVYKSAAEYLVGQSIYKEAWKARYPNKKIDPLLSVTLLDMNEISKRNFAKETAALDKASKLPNYCPAEESRAFFDKQRAAFLNYRQRQRR